VALIAVVAACGGAAHSGSSSPTPSLVTVSSPSPTWTLGLGPTAISTVDFSCRLPVFVDIGQGRAGGFIEFPSGTFTADPAAAQVGSITRPGREVVDNVYVHYYDHAYARWLPVTRNAVSPDGAHYAYVDRALSDPQNPEARATIHVVAVKTGVDLAFDGGSWSVPYVVLDYTTDGIYLITNRGVYVGLWLMDPATGVITRVANVFNVQGQAAGNDFWVGAINPNDLHPVAGIAPDQLERLSLADGGRVAWLYRPGSSVYFIGQDVGGHPIVFVAGAKGQTELVLVLGPGISRSILVGGNGVPTLSGPISDSHGVWFGSPDGIFLYSDANGMKKVSNQPGYPANGCF
jgi:hypothetical protein